MMLGILLLTAVASPVGAQAFCALRDPAEQIYAVYPAATSYRSVVRTVDTQTRNAVSSMLPFTVHSRELGQHTLYVAQGGRQSLGLVHVRSESSDWGIIEIAWAIDLDLHLRDFRFQRCRGSGCASVDTEQMRSLLRGKDLAALRAMLTADGEALRTPAGVETEPGRRLATTVVRSALKTLAVTQLVWSADLTQGP
jgi:hypothetical protein